MSIRSEIDSFHETINALPDGPEKNDAIAALISMQRDAALIDRLNEANRIADRTEAAKTQRGGLLLTLFAIGLLICAALALAMRPGMEASAVSLFAIFIGAILGYQGLFVLIKGRFSKGIASPRDWQSFSVIQALRDRKQPQTTSASPVWQNGKTDRRLATRSFRYEPIAQALVAEVIAGIPCTWNSCKVIIDCDGISIRCRVTGADSTQKVEVTSAIVSLGAQLFARMGSSGDRWGLCTIALTRSTLKSWSFKTDFKFVGAFPTPGHVTSVSSTNDEMERIVTEVERSSHGELAQLDEQMHQETRPQKKAFIKQLAVERPLPAPQKPLVTGKRFRLPALLVMSLVVCGAVMELTLGDGFVFAKANAYRSVMPWLFLIILPPSAFLCFFLTRADKTILARYPTWWVRRLIVFPVTSALLSATIVISPLGWASFLGWVVGTHSDHIEAKVLRIGGFSRSSKSCTQRVTLEVSGNSSDICLEDRLMGQVPSIGDAVDLTGRTSIFGVYVDEIRAK